jgi:hypothetical protein
MFFNYIKPALYLPSRGTDLLGHYTFSQRNELFKKTILQPVQDFPEHRRPTLKQIRQMMPAVTRHARLHSDPFTAVHILAERMPRNVYKYVTISKRSVTSHSPSYSYTPHDFAKPDSVSQFTCGLTTDFALENLLWHGMQDGIGADTSWQNKNENRAAVTFLICVDENAHLIPGKKNDSFTCIFLGAALLSANIKKQTLAEFFRQTKKRVIHRAREILQSKYCYIPSDESY